ncbi:hypothetical protein O181_029001 [Austropuccinia psidii MF-1]|uniref:Uncharacterized protein n=1 Tax=Austropuccinia psidii MF-1 TaxID=1389203 RepID=A0A9Q3CQA0_9BASI|nr:hypothetical protein [Austropuccinia psidii MF-1]
MGLIIQQETQSQPAINTALMGRLEVFLSTYEKTLNLGQVIVVLKACTQQEEEKTMLTTSTSTTQAMDFYHLNLQGGKGMSEVNTDGPFVEDTVDPAVFQAIIKATVTYASNQDTLQEVVPGV